MKFIKIYFFLILISFFTIQCTTSTDPTGTTDASTSPADHTVNEHGVMHKTGLQDPTNNCVSCHGSDLRGGTEAPSCYSCHSKKW